MFSKTIELSRSTSDSVSDLKRAVTLRAETEVRRCGGTDRASRAVEKRKEGSINGIDRRRQQGGGMETWREVGNARWWEYGTA